jgi:hypothetical protein
MEMDAALALSQFSRALVGIRPTLKFRGEIISLHLETLTVTERVESISGELQARMKQFEGLVGAHQDALVAVDRTIRFAKAILPFVPFSAVVGVYMFFRAHLQASNLTTDGIAMLVSAISLLPPYRFLKARLRRKKSASVVMAGVIDSGQRGPARMIGTRDGGTMEGGKGAGTR